MRLRPTLALGTAAFTLVALTGCGSSAASDGPITLNYEALEFPSDGEQRLCVYGAEPGSPSAESLRLLSSLCAPALESDRAVPPGT